VGKKAIKKKLENQDKNIELVFNYLDELIENKKIQNLKNKLVLKIQTKNNLH
jgi:hypothetical protein